MPNLPHKINLSIWQAKRVKRQRRANGQLAPSPANAHSQVSLTEFERSIIGKYVHGFGQRGGAGANLSAWFSAATMLLQCAISGEYLSKTIVTLSSIMPDDDTRQAFAANLQSLADELRGN